MKKLWLIFGFITLLSFATLLWIGTEIFREAPPIPVQVVTTDGNVLIDADEISKGQNVWQAMGGMQVGSIWGHGSYVAPDWTADYLHREAELFSMICRTKNIAKISLHWILKNRLLSNSV